MPDVYITPFSAVEISPDVADRIHREREQDKSWIRRKAERLGWLVPLVCIWEGEEFTPTERAILEASEQAWERGETLTKWPLGST